MISLSVSTTLFKQIHQHIGYSPLQLLFVMQSVYYFCCHTTHLHGCVMTPYSSTAAQMFVV